MIKENINIIIAEDNQQFIDGLKIVLRKNIRFNIIDICKNGKELVESSFLPQTDLIISDIEMPIMNGLEAAKIINFKFPKIQIIALTMHFENIFLEDLISAGFKGFIYKPDVSKKLNEVIISVLDNNFIFPDYLNIN